MKTTKKLFALLLSLTMVMMLGLTVFAAGTGAITVENATPGKVYTAYKVFDATYNGEAASYYIDKDSEWYELVVNAKSGSELLFNVEPLAADTNRCVVKFSVSDSSRISTWFNSEAVKTAAAGFTGIAKTAENGTVKFDNLDFGYYYISSTLGATATITNMRQSATVIDKNQTPGWGEEGGKKIVKADGTLASIDTAAIGDKINFKVTVNNALNYSKADKIKQYSINDLEGAAISCDFHSVVVKVNGVEIKGGWIEDHDGDSDIGHAVDKDDTTTTYENCSWYIENQIEDNGRFFIHIHWQNEDGSFRYTKADGTPNQIEVTYTATLEGNASMGTDFANNINTANLSWKVDNGSEGEDNTPSIVRVYSYAFAVFKKDGHANTPLAGAEFQIEDAEGNILKLLKSATQDDVYYLSNDYTKSDEVADAVYTSQADELSTFVTPADGNIVIKGMKGGNYKLVETKAPDGYNQLKDKIDITLSQENINGLVDRYSVVLETVENQKGSVLPETGGTGTMVFIALGALAVIGAGVFLVTNKRMSKEAL